jgi:hypothetical protein
VVTGAAIVNLAIVGRSRKFHGLSPPDDMFPAETKDYIAAAGRKTGVTPDP